MCVRGSHAGSQVGSHRRGQLLLRRRPAGEPPASTRRRRSSGKPRLARPTRVWSWTWDQNSNRLTRRSPLDDLPRHGVGEGAVAPVEQVGVPVGVLTREALQRCPGGHLGPHFRSGVLVRVRLVGIHERVNDLAAVGAFPLVPLPGQGETARISSSGRAVGAVPDPIQQERPSPIPSISAASSR